MDRRDLTKALLASATGAPLIPQDAPVNTATSSYARSAAERAAGVFPTSYDYPPGDVRRYGAVPGDGKNAVDATNAFQAALNCGYSPQIAAGDYGISRTLTTTTVNQVLTGLGNAVSLHKYADVPLLNILHLGSGAVNVSFFGAHDGFGNLPRPANAPRVKDTTDNIIIGTTGKGAPFFWVLDRVFSDHAGRDGVHHNEGPGGKIGILSCSYNARWGFWCQKIVVLPGGVALDTSHVTAQYLHCVSNGRGDYEEGGNIFLQGNAFCINCKSFGAWGDGLRIDGIYNRITVFTELDGAVNKDIAPWGRGQAVDRGDFRRYLNNCYVATTSGTTGAVSPSHVAGAASDGGVMWQFRGGLAIGSLGNSLNQNDIQVIYSNGIHRVQSTDTLSGHMLDGRSPVRAQNQLSPKSVRLGRLIDFGADQNQGDYSYIDLNATTNAPGEFDASHSAAGAGKPVEFFWGRNGATNPAEALRFRGSGHGFLADIPHGGRVVACGDAGYSLAGKSASEADIYTVALTANRDFDFDVGGIDILPGRRVVIINLGGFTLHIHSRGQASTLSGNWTYDDHEHDLTARGDWLEFIYVGSNTWLARGRRGRVPV